QDTNLTSSSRALTGDSTICRTGKPPVLRAPLSPRPQSPATTTCSRTTPLIRRCSMPHYDSKRRMLSTRNSSMENPWYLVRNLGVNLCVIRGRKQRPERQGGGADNYRLPA